MSFTEVEHLSTFFFFTSAAAARFHSSSLERMFLVQDGNSSYRGTTSQTVGMCGVEEAEEEEEEEEGGQGQ